MRSKSEIVNNIKDIAKTMAKQYNNEFKQEVVNQGIYRTELLITLCSINQSLLVIAEALIDIRDIMSNGH